MLGTVGFRYHALVSSIGHRVSRNVDYCADSCLEIGEAHVNAHRNADCAYYLADILLGPALHHPLVPHCRMFDIHSGWRIFGSELSNH